MVVQNRNIKNQTQTDFQAQVILLTNNWVCILFLYYYTRQRLYLDTWIQSTISSIAESKKAWTWFWSLPLPSR
jgi:hypothetical protein